MRKVPPMAVVVASWVLGAATHGCGTTPSEHDAGTVDDAPASVDAPSPRDAPQTPAPLQFGIMVHLEGWPDMMDVNQYNLNIQRLRAYGQLFASHGARMTLEAHQELTAQVTMRNDTVYRDMEAMGHAMGVHADVGYDPTGSVTQADLVAELTTRKASLSALGVMSTGVSGVCSRLDWVSAIADAGYLFATGVVGYCFQSMPAAERPAEYRMCASPAACHQTFPATIAGQIHPWRMHSGADWTSDSPAGHVVIMPSGGGMNCAYEDATNPGTSSTMCSYTDEDNATLLANLRAAMAAQDPGQVNAYYVAWSFGTAYDIARLERWLVSIDPLVASGQVVWRTIPQMYGSYVDWERTHR
ncbi:MAG: hypothetical protein WCJ30_16890 [Deltaproteobacteria bacterium]